MKFTPENAGQETEAIDEEVIAVVFPQNADLAVFISESPAVEEEAQFGGEGDSDGDDGREMEICGCLPAVAHD